MLEINLEECRYHYCEQSWKRRRIGGGSVRLCAQSIEVEVSCEQTPCLHNCLSGYEISHEGIDFVSLRWHDVGELISPICGDFAKEMNVYLKSGKLIMNNFDSKDLEVLDTLFSTVEKINSIFRDDVSRYFVRGE
ncbi:MAG UNVERIFIED_CONTAM: hypothetical protein LVR29_21990 [Microcystis novacekii LVE1205-3]|jgi:hypothetical protein